MSNNSALYREYQRREQNQTFPFPAVAVPDTCRPHSIQQQLAFRALQSQQMQWQQAHMLQLQQSFMSRAQQMHLQQQQQQQLQQQQKQRSMQQVKLQAQQQYLQNLLQMQMIRALYLYNVNRPKPRFMAKNILEIQPIAKGVDQLSLPGISHPPTFHSTFQKLSPTLQSLLRRVTVFKFDLRKATTEEYQAGQQCTPDAAFFIKTLRDHKKFDDNAILLGLRCNCCEKTEKDVYVKGSTSFVDVAQRPQESSIHNALQMRLRHLVTCPGVSSDDKTRFAATMEHESIQETKFHEFVNQWTQAMLAAHFPSHLPDHIKKFFPQHQIGGDANILLAEAVISEDLESALSFASQLARDRTIIMDNMQDNMQEGGFPPSLFMELFCRLWQVEVTPCHFRNLQEVNLCCTQCKENGNLQWTRLFSKNKLPKESPELIRDFVLSHTETCPSISDPIKRVFIRQTKTMDKSFWYHFCSWWQTHLTKRFRFCQQPTSINRRHCDHYRYITMVDRKIQPYQDLPFLRSSSNPDLQRMKHVPTNPSNVIILDNEFCQDLPGNQWFRRHISKYRLIYQQASEPQQHLMIETILQFIARSGHSFLVSCDESFDHAPRHQTLKFVTNALLNGFPELLRPPFESNAPSKVFDLEYAPKVGIFYGGIRWGESLKSSEYQDPAIQNFDKETLQASRDVWGKAWDASPQTILQAIKMRNTNLGDQQTQRPSDDEILATSPETRPLVHEQDSTVYGTLNISANLDDVPHTIAPAVPGILGCMQHLPTEGNNQNGKHSIQTPNNISTPLAKRARMSGI